MASNKLQAGSDGKLRVKAGTLVVAGDSTACCCAESCDGNCFCSGTANAIPSIDVTFGGILFVDAPGWTKTCGDPGWINRTVQLPVPDVAGYTYTDNFSDGTCKCTDAYYTLTNAISFVADGIHTVDPTGSKACCDMDVEVRFAGTTLLMAAGIRNCSGPSHPPNYALFTAGFNFVTWDCTARVLNGDRVTPPGSGYYSGTASVTPTTRRPLPTTHTYANLGPLVGDCCPDDAPAP